MKQHLTACEMELLTKCNSGKTVSQRHYVFEENDFKGLKGISFDISVYDVSPRLTLIK